MYEPFDETAAQVLLAVTPGESIRQVAHRLHTPYETVRQTVNELEDAGYLRMTTACSLPTITSVRRHETCWPRVRP
jgi:transposase